MKILITGSSGFIGSQLFDYLTKKKYNVFGLDFAYLIPTETRHPLENTLRFSLLFDFEGFKEQNKEASKKDNS